MTTRVLENHLRRVQLTDELHARPFAPIGCPARVAMIAFKETAKAVERDPAADRAHLARLVEALGGPPPEEGADHYLGDFGRFRLKWERHAEFVIYILIEEGPHEGLFTGELIDCLPQDWLDAAPGNVVAAVEVEILAATDRQAALDMASGELAATIERESLVMAGVLDGAGIALADFRIHEGGFSRFAVILHGEASARRVGRLVQRLFEIETYRVMAMLALPIARAAGARLSEVERRLAEVTAEVAGQGEATTDPVMLRQLIELSAELEAQLAATAFRFGAARAYAAIVTERIEMLREERVIGRQLFSEFMLRRFRPAMRTCESVEGRMNALAERASRIADLLRTRVDVAMEAQNQQLLVSMDRRVALQLRLQETVEGLSVVAISYYAVSLAGYVLAPVAKLVGLDKTVLTALIALPVIAVVWGLVCRMRRRLMAAHKY